MKIRSWIFSSRYLLLQPGRDLQIDRNQGRPVVYVGPVCGIPRRQYLGIRPAPCRPVCRHALMQHHLDMTSHRGNPTGLPLLTRPCSLPPPHSRGLMMTIAGTVINKRRDGSPLAPMMVLTRCPIISIRHLSMMQPSMMADHAVIAPSEPLHVYVTVH